jgi:L-alanine-DL-glutamate epimerase-like enolase superfamily enzyme
MIIERAESWPEELELNEPFSIAYKSEQRVNVWVVRLTADNGLQGFGLAHPMTAVTGETPEACAWALRPARLSLLERRELTHPNPLFRQWAADAGRSPAAWAAVDMALYDLWSRGLGLPLTQILGREVRPLPTAMTLGIRTREETLEEAHTFIGMGAKILKLKIGRDVRADLAMTEALRTEVGEAIDLRVDANQGYSLTDLKRFLGGAASMNLEFIEQPLPVGQEDELRRLPEDVRNHIALDESLQTPQDALKFSREPRPAGIFNIKLMKCGGIGEALAIANIAAIADIALMWGCVIESRLSLAAALHAAFACRTTRYLDLDGDYDLVRELGGGGFSMAQGLLRTLDLPGLGTWLVE